MLSDLITIVVPCKNEESYIGYLLDELRTQEVGRTRIIIADCSTDNTRWVIEQNRGSLNVEVIEGGPVSWAKNSGARLATTPYILFIDADHDYAGMSQKSKNTAEILLQLLSTKNTFTKGHPRLGRTNFSKDYNFNELERQFPLEFYNLSNCYAIIGFYSYSLVNLSNMGLPVISLLLMFDFESSEARTLKIIYLKSSFKTISELESIIKNLNRM